MPKKTTIEKALQKFAESVRKKSSQLTRGEPEDQLRGPFDTFMKDAASALGWDVVCTGETPLPGRLGRPDYAIHLNRLLAGYVELKAPGIGANAKRFRKQNRDQFNRFSAIPNILYTDGNEWALYRSGELVDSLVRLSGNIVTEGRDAATSQNAHDVECLLRDFLSWQPIIPTDRNGKIDLKGFADIIAPLCRMLRDDVTDALQDPDSPLNELARDWRHLLFPDASNEQFADAYAQTVTFALLLGRSEGADPLTLETAESSLKEQHNLLSRALQVLTDPRARVDITASLDLLLRVIAVVPPATLTTPEDPWLYFYEDFLAAYDPRLRKNVGAYYTPVQVVRSQVRLIDSVLVNRLKKPLGFADPGVVTLDPAAGTGTYLLGVIDHAFNRVEREQGSGAVPGQATTLANSLYGFELMVGPYAVTELRVSRALRDRGATIPDDGTHIYLTDTLESPNTRPPELPFFLQPIAEQHAKALRVKSKVPVIVCLGNPPYDRHDAVDVRNEHNLARYGGWVRFADPVAGNTVNDKKGNERKLKTPQARLSERERRSILRDFITPAAAAGHGIHIKNLYNLYVYFWRWALWKVFEHESAHGPGVISFISASSYLDGDAFCGMREHIRRVCDEVWILDLGGEGRGTRREENVFAIQTPVAIAVAVRSKKGQEDKPAKVRYARIEGTRAEKLAQLDAISDFNSIKWKTCPKGWQAPFRPAGKGDYFAWPLLTDIMPWQHSGVKAGRTWVISTEEETLAKRWQVMLRARGEKREGLFKNSPTGRKVHEAAIQLPPSGERLEAISESARGAPPPGIIRYAYRSFDRQYILADARLLDRPGPDLWRAHSDHQLYLTTLLNHPLGDGPAVTACALIPDLHHFRGSYGAKEVFPLYSTRDATKVNILPGFLDLLSDAYGFEVTPEELFAYIYGVLAHPGFTTRYAAELETRQLRVPITRDRVLFKRIRDLGAQLLWLHTYGERFVPKRRKRGYIPRGKARCKKAVPGGRDGYPESYDYNIETQTLRVGEGQFAPVTPDVYKFEVSGLKVVQSWLRYRMKRGGGKKSSPLDDIRPERWTSQFTTELLELLWVLEATLDVYPEQEALLNGVINGECFRADELPEVPEYMRKCLTGESLFEHLQDKP